MALPWQADFLYCDGRGLVAHPAARHGRHRPAVGARQQEAVEQPIDNYLAMVDHVLELGFVVPQEIGGETVFVEVERDPQFPRRDVR